MFRCFVGSCAGLFVSADSYIDHLQKVHQPPSDYRFQCTAPNCNQVISKWYIFKRHLKNHLISKNYKNNDFNETHKLRDDESCTSEPREKQICGTNQKSEKCHIIENLTKIDQAAVNFTLSLHCRPNITRLDVRRIQEGAQEVYQRILENIENLPIQIPDDQTAFEFTLYMNKLKKVFEFIDTDFKFFKHLENNNSFRFPEIVHVQTNKTVQEKYLQPSIEEDKNYMVLMPIEFQLRRFFETDGVLNEVVAYIDEVSKSDDIINFINGSLYKELREKYKEDIIIPISLYSDEYEINDPQSSHSKKHAILGVYYTFPCLPDCHGSKLNNIFVAAISRKVVVKDVGMNLLLEGLIEKFTKIELNGMLFVLNKQVVTVRFVVSVFQGDNLGIHTSLQFMTFGANYYCRFCKRSKDCMQHDCEEHEEMLRNKQNYLLDVQMNCPSDTGIKMNSIFNNLPSFHVASNFTVDAMHDVFSNGILQYGLVKILNYAIYEKQWISIKFLNTRINEFAKTLIDDSLKRMPDVGETFITEKKTKSVVIKSTASEMKSFAHYFTFLFGSYFPENDKVWEFARNLILFVDKILSSSFSCNDVNDLKKLASINNKLYTYNFNENLKPKHHFTLHYGTVVEKIGPLSKMMCFRQEAKHKMFKEYAHVTTSRKNICYTLGIKASLDFTHNLLNKEFFKLDILGNFSKISLPDQAYYTQLPVPLPFALHSETFSSDNIKYKGTTYKLGLFLTITNVYNVNLHEIEHLLKVNGKIYIVTVEWTVGEFSVHFCGNEALFKTNNYHLSSINKFDGPPTQLHNINCRYFFRKKSDFNNTLL